jgi:hypothetical protein
MRNGYKTLAEKLDRRISVGRSGLKCEFITQMNVKE